MGLMKKIMIKINMMMVKMMNIWRRRRLIFCFFF